MKKIIGEIAGKIWKTLGIKGRVDISRVSLIMKEKEEIVLLGLGWLAREDKLDFHLKEGRIFTSLNRKEQEIFKKFH